MVYVGSHWLLLCDELDGPFYLWSTLISLWHFDTGTHRDTARLRGNQSDARPAWRENERSGACGIDGWMVQRYGAAVWRCCGVAELGTVSLGIPHMNGTRGGGWGKVRDRTD